MPPCPWLLCHCMYIVNHPHFHESVLKQDLVHKIHIQLVLTQVGDLWNKQHSNGYFVIHTSGTRGKNGALVKMDVFSVKRAYSRSSCSVNVSKDCCFIY